MLANHLNRSSKGAQGHRDGTAAVEFACCLPLLVLIMTGLWQVGRFTEVQQVMWNGAREAARDASLGQDNLQGVATNLLTYLQGAEQTAFGKGHSTSMIAPVITLPANSTGYTCWDNTANKELFTMSFTDLTNSTVTDPTAMTQLDLYQIGVQVPFSSISWSPVTQISGMSRLKVTVVWTSLVDTPFQIAPDLPAQ
jgi:Flp pilus assembly protein TadG